MIAVSPRRPDLGFAPALRNKLNITLSDSISLLIICNWKGIRISHLQVLYDNVQIPTDKGNEGNIKIFLPVNALAEIIKKKTEKEKGYERE